MMADFDPLHVESINSRLDLESVAERLGTRGNWHEPDEVGVSAVVVGTTLDNACGNDIRAGAVESDYQEMIVLLKKDDAVVAKVNLANLLAWAEGGKRDA